MSSFIICPHCLDNNLIDGAIFSARYNGCSTFKYYKARFCDICLFIKTKEMEQEINNKLEKLKSWKKKYSQV